MSAEHHPLDTFGRRPHDTRSRFRSLLQGVGFGFVNLLIGLFLGLVLSPYIVNTLGDRFYAINVTVSVFVGCFSLLDMGLNLAVSRYFTQHFSRGETQECLELANTAFFFYSIIGAVAYGVILLCGVGLYFVYPYMENRDLILQVLCINGIAFALNFPLMAVSGVINGTLRQELTGARDVGIRIIGAGLSFLVLYLGYGLIALSLVNLITPFLNIFVLGPMIKAAFPDFVLSRKLVRWTLLPNLLSYGVGNFFSFIADMVANKGGLFVIATMLTLEAVTPYSLVGVNLTNYYIAVMSLVGGSWLINWFTYLHATNDTPLFTKSIRFAHKLCTFTATFILYGLIFWGPDFIVRWIGAPYLCAYDSLLLLAVSVWVYQSQAVNTKILFAIARYRFLTYVTLVGAIANILLAILFVSLGYGISGVAMSTLLVEMVVRGGIVPYYVCRIIQEDYDQYLLRYVKNILGATCAWIPCYWVSQQLLAPSYPRLFLTGGLCVLVYIPFIFLLGFNHREKTELWNLIVRVKKW